MSELTELLPCPFCGAGETTFDDLTFGSGTVMTVRLRHNCGADDWPAIEFSGLTKAEVIAAWNRRHPVEAGEVVALREALTNAASAMEAEAVVLRAAGLAKSCAEALERKAASARRAIAESGK